MAWPEISGRRIAGHRERLGITQVELAKALGIGRSTLQGIENNRANPSLALIVKIVRNLVPFEALLHQGLSDKEEYNDARHGHPDGPQGRAPGALDNLWQHAPRMQVGVRGGGDEVRRSVQPLRGPLRPDPGGT